MSKLDQNLKHHELPTCRTNLCLFFYLYTFALGLQDSDSGENLSRLHATSSRIGSRLSLHSNTSKRSLHSRLSRGRTPSSNAPVPPELDTARQVAEGREATWPELQCGLAYNVTTKRLHISVLRANRLHIPEASLRTPSKFRRGDAFYLYYLLLLVSRRAQASSLDTFTQSSLHRA